MGLKRLGRAVLPPTVWHALQWMRRTVALRLYAARGGRPFGTGYGLYQQRFIGGVLANAELLGRFARGEALPAGYGIGLDERCVEYPWLVAQLNPGPGTLLDAGSTLNRELLLSLPIVQAKVLHILTLAPEDACFWQRGISYLYHDLRSLLVRDAFYDTIVCLSTLEHVGCDNSAYTGDAAHREDRREDYLIALGELVRVLKPTGTLLITVPYGAYCNLGVQQQFDGAMLERMREALRPYGEIRETFYRYSSRGWTTALEKDCADCQYVRWSVDIWANGRVPKPLPTESDRAVAARAVACLRLNRESACGS
jgi:hypothetical protein